MLIDKIKELDDKLYAAFGELHENKSHLCGYEQVVAERLIELYKLDYKLIRGDMVEEDFKEQVIDRRKKIMAPKRWRGLFFRKRCNDAEYLLNEEAELKAREFFDNKERALDKLLEAIEKADNEPDPAKAFEEPENGVEPPKQENPDKEPKPENKPTEGKETSEKNDQQTPADNSPLKAEKNQNLKETPCD